MKRFTILLTVLAFPLALLSQESKYEYTPKVKSRILIADLLGEINVKNNTGNAIVITSDIAFEKPERAEGLQLLGAMEDNTGLGLNVSEADGVVKIVGTTKKVKEYAYTISVPQGIKLSIDYHSPFAKNNLKVDSYSGSLEIKTLSSNVTLTNCTGPLTVSSVSGSIEAEFNGLNQEQPTSLATVSGLVDITLPAATKANIQVSNITGDVYNNLDLVNASENEKDNRSVGLDEIKHRNNTEYTLNGGGQKLLLKSISGNIYLRKK
ncbi:DUF4097 family beta strand repeat protein [Maribellus sp. CM-23]|uniref:DUF4097 family beta strand repeat-containing protein n=1 Tax=Maribellus sp. CM-23 TaxID=2781026 RepID=UPI001F42C4E3|nr:DUF4097 family beta strand repeat-containing protein [Maribellus sp. CM-23]MCE4563758.1 DUF4097 family beta strand repeat protein [Maribellus sp. CM-23]